MRNETKQTKNTKQINSIRNPFILKKKKLYNLLNYIIDTNKEKIIIDRRMKVKAIKVKAYN